jgi:hypothetical protein
LHHFPPRLRFFSRFPALVTFFTLLGGCLAAAPAVPLPAQPVQNATQPASTSIESAWETLAPGLETRLLRPGGGYSLTQFVALRINPALYMFRSHYSPRLPLRPEQWQANYPGMIAFVNSNFFNVQGEIVGMLVSDGVTHGQSYVGFGGMVQVQNGQVRVRSLIAEPYYGEALEQAAQAFPMLILNGVPQYERTQGDRASRRTIVGQDVNGNIVLITTSSLIGMRLADLGAYLASTDLQLVNALNLDGGGSSMMAVNVGDSFIVPAFDPVPAIWAVYPLP